MIITGFNPSLDQQEQTWLSLAAQTGATTLTVKNTESFQSNDRILVGMQGQENAEIVTVQSTPSPGTSLAISATVFSHNADEPVTRLRYDSVKFYRSTNGSSGAYTLLATVALDVDDPNQVTTYDDTIGLASYFYEVSYYNSISTLESALSDPIPGSGYARNQVGFLIDEILREVSDMNNLTVDPTELLGWFNEVNDDLLTRTARPYRFLYSRLVTGVTSQQNTIPYPTDPNGNQLMWKFDFMQFNFVVPIGAPPSFDDDDPGSNIPTNSLYTVRILPLLEFKELTEDQNVDPEDQMMWAALDDATKVFRIYPTPADTQPATLYIYYYAYFTQLQTYGQTFQTPTYQPYKKFALYRYFMKQGENNNQYLQIAQIYKQEYEREVMNLTKANRKDIGSPQGFQFGANKFNSYDNNVQPYQGRRKF